MRRYILPVLIAFSVLAFSCAGRKNKAVHKDIIPEKDLISILTDVHIADGLLALPKINYLFSSGDTLSSYIYVIEKHGYTKDQMDRTMRFYFIKRPKKLVKIYDKVLGTISVLESRVNKEIPAFYGTKEVNVWPGKPFYSLPGPPGKDTAWFDFPVDFVGTYNLKFTLTIYPDDQSVDPYAGVYFLHIDSTGNEKRIYFPEVSYIKDGRPHNYSVLLKQDLPVPLRLRGWFVNQENQAPFIERHIIVDNISLSRKFL
jgi:hypothetical protein